MVRSQTDSGLTAAPQPFGETAEKFRYFGPFRLPHVDWPGLIHQYLMIEAPVAIAVEGCKPWARVGTEARSVALQTPGKGGRFGRAKRYRKIPI